MSWKAGLLTPPLSCMCARFWVPSKPARLCWRVRAARTREARVELANTQDQSIRIIRAGKTRECDWSVKDEGCVRWKRSHELHEERWEEILTQLPRITTNAHASRLF